MSDYLRLIDSSLTEYEAQDKNNAINNKNHKITPQNIGNTNKQGPNVAFESLSAIAKLFSEEYKANEDSALDMDDENVNNLNIEEVTEDDASEAIDKQRSHFNSKNNQKENMNNNPTLINVINEVVHRIKSDKANTSNSAIAIMIKIELITNSLNKPGMNTLNRKLTIKSRKDNEKSLIYNDDYKDQHSKKRQTFVGNLRVESIKKGGKSIKNEERVGFKKPFKTLNSSKQSHKRSQSLNKSINDQRYRSVPQTVQQIEGSSVSKNYAKQRLNCYLNNQNTQMSHYKEKYDDWGLDISIKNSRKHGQIVFRK